jgi:hypothetical protein
MKKLLILLVLLSLGVGLYVFSNQGGKNTEVVETKQDRFADEIRTTDTTTTETSDEDMSLSENIVKDNETLIATLIDVSGGTSSGKGYVLRKGSKLYHYVLAELPEPQGTNKYEGWLVKKKPSLKFFSTGVMQMTEDGHYELLYTSDNESLGYDFVVITEETKVDETPEKHIIEGDVL